ncbi:hypothetical protein E1I18_03285 [Mycoplasmopsis mucosicanis]|uniref:Acid phosphatase n=1 Tax=Mycoplasmopsis mucosicanis TaxID=458208 RepID=A0A507SQC6_9BACT|nr:HAD family acid phosphatase [Mycoplasmopsis mucosicanis]TQC51313.1 hypothetical protein E1I18_03285 [Mycoplasmopsis mucosicanis]
MKKLRYLLGAFAPLSLAPIATVACNQPVENKLTLEKLTQEVNKLTTDEKIQLVNSLTLSDDEKAKLINDINSGVGITASIIWYMTSAEQKVAALQAYTLATVAFDNLKKRGDTDKIDYSKVDKTTGAVKKAENGKAIPVVFMDIDETVFKNELSESDLVIKHKGKFLEDEKNKIDAVGNRNPVPGAIEFINHVFENGGIVLFNSGIPQLEDSIKGIMKNLIAKGVKKEYVHEWMFWCSGVQPVLKDGKFDKTPWKTAINEFKKYKSSDKAYNTLKKSTTKNQRMNAVSDNKDGWNFKASDANSDDGVVTKVIMRIGDDFGDFYDDAYKSKRNNTYSNEWLEKTEGAKDLFTKVEGAQGIKVTKAAKSGEEAKVEKVAWHQFNVQVPGNAMYGSWASQYGHGSFKKLWDALVALNKDSKDGTAETK